jgi:hypothetical protein
VPLSPSPDANAKRGAISDEVFKTLSTGLEKSPPHVLVLGHVRAASTILGQLQQLACYIEFGYIGVFGKMLHL